MTITTDFSSLNENRLARVVLTHVKKGKRRAFVSWVKDDLSINTTNEYVSPFEDLLADKISGVETGKGLVQAGSGVLRGLPFISDLIDKAVESPTLKNVTFTMSRWHSTAKIVLPVPMTFITLNSKSNVMNEAIELTSRAHPRAGKEGFLSPPGGYRLLYGGKDFEQIRTASDAVETLNYENFSADGSWSINIGEWFYASNLLLTAADMTISKVRTKYGPLKVEVQCNFEPFRQITEQEYRGYFRNISFEDSAALDTTAPGASDARRRNRRNRRRFYINLLSNNIPNL